MNHRFSASLILRISAIALCALACDRAPTAPVADDAGPRFALSENTVIAYDLAIGDLRERIVPALPLELQPVIASRLEELRSALEQRSESALQRALARLNDVVSGFDAADENSTTIATELEPVRLVIEHARGLVVH